MKRELLSRTEAAAFGAKLSGVEVMPNHPSVMANDVYHKIKELSKEMHCKLVSLESSQQLLPTAIGFSLAGKRTFLATSNPLNLDELSQLSFLRLPVTIAKISKAYGTMTIGIDHNDILSYRDSGSMIFMPENNQEILESVMQSYFLGENKKISLPSIINIDSPYNLRETVILPSENTAKNLLKPFRPSYKISPKEPEKIGLVDPKDYGEMKLQQQKAMENAKEIIKKSDEMWNKKFKRNFSMIEEYQLKDALNILVMAGSYSPTAKAVVNKLRSEGKKVGLLRIKMIRPWPEKEIEKALENVKHVGVLDQSISLGSIGILAGELSKSYKGACTNFIAGLGGKFLSEKDFVEIFKTLDKGDKERAWLI